jgi:hypothetical protein
MTKARLQLTPAIVFDKFNKFNLVIFSCKER